MEQEDAMTDWINVNDRLPDSGVTVLAVKQLKNGRRDVTLAYCIREYERYDPVTRTYSTEPYWVCGGNNNILWWMPLPPMPKEG